NLACLMPVSRRTTAMTTAYAGSSSNSDRRWPPINPVAPNNIADFAVPINPVQKYGNFAVLLHAYSKGFNSNSSCWAAQRDEFELNPRYAGRKPLSALR